jgi:hypothetical protein
LIFVSARAEKYNETDLRAGTKHQAARRFLLAKHALAGIKPFFEYESIESRLRLHFEAFYRAD